MKQIIYLTFGLVVSCLMTANSFAQDTGTLYQEIKKMDSLYFSAQNNCDLEMYDFYLSEDFEFFHDVAGKTSSKDDEMSDMSIFCGDEQRNRQPIRRQLTEGTLQVFPMDNFGALEFADHLFYLQIPDGTEKLIGSGKFTALWKEINDEWKLTRVISYDHQHVAEVELDEEILNQYVGDYTLLDRIVNIKKEGKFLRVTDVANGEAVWTKLLFPQSENMFYLNYENVVYEFLKSGDQVGTLKIYEGGKLFEEAIRE